MANKWEDISEEEQKEAKRGALLAIFAMALGFVTIGVSIRALQSQALDHIDKLVHLNEDFDSPGFVLTNKGIFWFLLAIGIAVACVAFIGIVGAFSRHKGLVAMYATITTILAICMVLCGIECNERRTLLEPFIQRQVDDYCNATTYIRLSMNVQCSWAPELYGAQVPTCGISCQQRVETLRQMEGCNVLPKLCKQFWYEEMDANACKALLSETSGPVMYAANYPMDYDEADLIEECGRHCDDDIVCEGYIYSPAHTGVGEDKPPQCLLTSGLDSRKSKPGTIPVWSSLSRSQVAAYTKGGSPQQCFHRTTPQVLDRLVTFDERMAWVAMGLGVTLLVVAVVACILMYNVNVRRQNRPNGNELCWMLICPCWSDPYHKELEMSDEEDSAN